MLFWSVKTPQNGFILLSPIDPSSEGLSSRQLLPRHPPLCGWIEDCSQHGRRDPPRYASNFPIPPPSSLRPPSTQPKLEISRVDPLNPIKQDEKKGKLRYPLLLCSITPYLLLLASTPHVGTRNVALPYPFNYGAFPQTWENPAIIDPDTKCKGDLDPMDVCEIGGKTYKTGDVIQVKVLGTWAMIDEGETDWKVLVIDVTDAEAAKYNDASDVPTAIVEKCFTFLRDYKIPDGNPPNTFAFNNQLMPRALAMTKAEEMHHEWKRLVTGAVPAKSNSPAYEYAMYATIIPPP